MTAIATIARAYTDEGLNARQIAARHGLSRSAVLTRLHAQGVAVRRSGWPSPVLERADADLVLLAELYAAAVSTSELASITGVCERTIAAWLADHGVPVRGRRRRSPDELASATAALSRHGLLEHASTGLRRSRAFQAELRRIDHIEGQAELPAGPLLAELQRRGLDTTPAARQWAETGVVTGARAQRVLDRLDLHWWEVWDTDPAATAFFEGRS